MKTIKSIVLCTLALCAMSFISCSPPSGVFVENTPTGKIIGTVRVTNGSYDVVNKDTTYYDYIGNNIEVELTKLTDQENKYNIVMYKVCFSNHMPVTIDLTIPAVDIDIHGNISGDNIIPYAGILGEYPRYTIHNLTGKVVFDAQGKAAALTFDMMCGKYQTNYQGMYTDM